MRILQVKHFDETLKQVALLKEKLQFQEKLETQSMEAEKLGEEGSSVKSDNTQYTEEEEGLGSNQYSFPELAALGFYYDPTMSASNLGLWACNTLGLHPVWPKITYLLLSFS